MKWDSWKLEPHEGVFWEREAGKGWRSWRSGRRFGVQQEVCGLNPARGRMGELRVKGGDLESGEGFVWVSPARGCRAGRGGPTTAPVLHTCGFPKPG